MLRSLVGSEMCIRDRMYDVEPVAALSEEEMEDYIKDLGQIFMRRVRRRDYHVPAADFLGRYREAIVSGVARWIMHSNKNSVRKIIRRLKSVCRHYGLVMIRSEGVVKLAEVTALVTWYAVSYTHLTLPTIYSV